MNQIITIRAFNDNYIYLYRYNQNSAIAIDPGQSSPVLKALDRHNLSLTAILATHHHADHIGGVADLKNKTGCKVIGADKQRIPMNIGIDQIVEDNQILTFADIEIKTIFTPGHTRTSVCYYLTQKDGNGILFTGDTLFISGCGRLFECDAKTMWNSLQKLTNLPDDTKVYPGHDYTLENCQFAMENEPDDPAIQQRLKEIQQAINLGKLTIPSTIAQEKHYNVFLRAKTPQAFAELRRKKDIF